MKGTPLEVIAMMKTMLKPELVEAIEKRKNEMFKKELIEQINRMTCNKRVRDKEIAKNPNCKKLYRKMFFNHYSMFSKE